jgi:hypothetical protein
METITSASNIRAIRDIIEDPRGSIEDRIDKADWAFANGESLFVNLKEFVSVVCNMPRTERWTYQSQDGSK